MNRKIIIDTDPGIDDAVAIIAAAHIPGFEILGITTVAGNVSVTRCTDNGLGLVQFLDLPISVYEGAADAMSHNPALTQSRADNVHGRVGLGGIVLDKAGRDKSNTHAVDFIIETVKNNPGQIELITLGPFTNIALAIEKEPEVMKSVKAIWSMGGGFARGNVTEYAEFNYWADPVAVKKVFEYGVHFPIYMYGLDVTHKSPFFPEDILFVAARGGKTGKLMLDMCLMYINSYFERYGKLNFVIHDLLTVICADCPDICEYNHCYTDVVIDGEEIGRTVCDLEHKSPNTPNVYVAIDVDSVRYKKNFIRHVFGDGITDYERLINA